MTRPALRWTAAAALGVFGAFSAQAMEATQWNPQADAAAVTSADALLAPSAWVAERREATQFRDGISRDSVTARADVRTELHQARRQGLMNDTGEAGATDRVLAQRAAFADAEHDRLMAMNTPAEPVGDPIVALMALTTPGWEMPAASPYVLVPDAGDLSLAARRDPSAPQPDALRPTTLAMAPTDDEWLRDERLAQADTGPPVQ